MPLKRRHARIPAAIALVALAAFAVLWAAARTPFVRGMIERAVTDETGLPTTVGKLRISFLPSPRLAIDDLAVAQPPGFGEEPLLEIGRIEIALPWRRVIGASDRLDAVAILSATARLRVAADGTANWSALFPTPVPAEDATVPAEPARWSIGALALAGSTVDYRDAASGSRWQLTGITTSAEEVRPGRAFPVELQLGGVFGTRTMHFAVKGEALIDVGAGRYAASGLDYRGWLGGDPLPLAGAELTGTLREATYENATGEARFADGRFRFAEIPGRFDGVLDIDEPALVTDFDVATDAFAPRASAIILGHPLPETTDPSAFSSLQLTLTAILVDGNLRLKPVTGQLDATRFVGSVVPAERSVRAELDGIDFNRYLPRAANPAPEKKATLEALAAQLEKLDLDAEVRIGEARVAGAKMRDVVIRVERGGEGVP